MDERIRIEAEENCMGYEKTTEKIRQIIEDWMQSYKINNADAVLQVRHKNGEEPSVSIKKDETLRFAGSSIQYLNGLVKNVFCKSLEEEGQELYYTVILSARQNRTKGEAMKRKAAVNTIQTGTEAEIKVTAMEPVFSLKDVILPQKTKKSVMEAVSLIKNSRTIYEDWGFEEVDPVNKTVINLYGPPGTGKTMTVHAICRELGKRLITVTSSEIESKFVGVSNKNLDRIFEVAQKEDAVIFFDEADSFLSKRMADASNGHEQSINGLKSQLLMKLENFNGTVFFATNFRESYDKAFESRILKGIEFCLPEKEGREDLLLHMLPKKAPYEEKVRNKDGSFNPELISQLAELSEGLAGRDFRNLMHNALNKALMTEKRIVTWDVLVETFSEKRQELDEAKKKAEEKKARREQERQKLQAKVRQDMAEGNFNAQKLESA